MTFISSILLLLLPLLFTLPSTSLAMDINLAYDLSGKASSVFSCEENNKESESYCQQICNDYTCTLSLSHCSDCLSTNNSSVAFFLATLGTYYKVSDELSRSEAFDYLSSKQIHLWNPKSIYNYSEFNGVFLRMRFDSLCSEDVILSEAVVFDHLDEHNRFDLSKDKVVYCNYQNLGPRFYQLVRN